MLSWAQQGVKKPFFSKKCIFWPENDVFSKKSFYKKLISDQNYIICTWQKIDFQNKVMRLQFSPDSTYQWPKLLISVIPDLGTTRRLRGDFHGQSHLKCISPYSPQSIQIFTKERSFHYRKIDNIPHSPLPIAQTWCHLIWFTLNTHLQMSLQTIQSYWRAGQPVLTDPVPASWGSARVLAVQALPSQLQYTGLSPQAVMSGLSIVIIIRMISQDVMWVLTAMRL